MYWRLLAVASCEWEKWAIWKSNCKKRFLENFIDSITILLNNYVRYFSSASGNPAACGLLFVNSVRWRTHWGFSLTFFYIYRSRQQQMLFQAATCKMLIIINSPLCRLCLWCGRSLLCTAAMQLFSPVSLVFALHMIKIWNHKNRNRTVNRGF